MSFLIIAGHRYPLEHGDTVVGGSGEHSLKAPQLADTSPVLVITYPADGLTTARALGSQPVKVNGEALDTKPRRLKHGDRMETSGVITRRYGLFSWHQGPASPPHPPSSRKDARSAAYPGPIAPHSTSIAERTIQHLRALRHPLVGCPRRPR